MSVETSCPHIDIVERSQFGKYHARSLRKEKKIPAVAYGNKIASVHFVVDFADFMKILPIIKSEKIILLKGVNGSFKAVIKDIKRDPVLDLPIHIDFHIVMDGQKIRTFVPINPINQNMCLSLKSGGFLNIVKRKIEVYCNTDSIPKFLPVDVGHATVGVSIRISDLTFPEGVECMLDPYTTVITVAGKKSAKTKDSDPSTPTSGSESAKSKTKAEVASKSTKQDEKQPKPSTKK